MSSAHVFWPPLAVLAMLVGVVMFLILKYGERLCGARTVALTQNYEIEDQSSENTTYMVDADEKASYRDMMIEPPEMIHLQEKETGRAYDYPEEKEFENGMSPGRSPNEQGKPRSRECAV